MNNLQNSIGALQDSSAFELSFRIRQAQTKPPKKCVLLLHGVGGSEMNLVNLATGIAPDTLVILTRGPLQIAAEQFAWFRVAFTDKGPSIVASEAEQSRSTLIRFVAQIQSAYGIAPQHTVIAGFSQGGIISASVALSAPESVAGFGILSGRILPELAPHLADKSRLKNLRAFIAHGEEDNILPVIWTQRAQQLLDELGVTYSAHLYPIEHAISAAVRSDFLEWLSSVDTA